MPDRPDFYLGTAIDGVNINAEQLNVRSEDLNNLIGKLTFSEAQFNILLGRLPNEQEKKLFDMVLVSLHGGFGLLPPTTFVPRIVAGTGVPIAQAMAAGYLASGPYHSGAIELAMRLFKSVLEEFRSTHGANASAAELEQFAYDLTATRIEIGQTIGGFGHPLLRIDPRPIHIRRLLCEMNANSVYFDIFDGITRCMREMKGISPNIDAITGAILMHLGFLPAHGAGLFLIARSAAMLAHIVEEQTEMPYQTMKRFMLLPIVSPRMFNADFKKLAKRFNVLRDNKIYGALRGLFSRNSRRANNVKETADLAVIQQHRSQRNGTAIAQELSQAATQPVREDQFANTSAALAANAAAEMAKDDSAEDATSPELLAGAAFFLSACLKSLPDSENADSEKSRKVEALVNSALELIRQ